MIQVLTYSGKDNDFKGDNIVVSSIHNPRSLDEFDINIISLAEEKMWVNFEDSIGEVNSYQDIDSLSKMIANSDKTRIIILIPQNIRYCYDYQKSVGSYRKCCELKNMIPEFKIATLAMLCKLVYDLKDIEYQALYAA